MRQKKATLEWRFLLMLIIFTFIAILLVVLMVMFKFNPAWLGKAQEFATSLFAE